MRQYSFRLTLSDCAFILASFMLLGAGLAIMLLNGFDVWFAYLLALPVFFSITTIRSALRSASGVTRPGGKQDGLTSSQSSHLPE